MGDTKANPVASWSRQPCTALIAAAIVLVFGVTGSSPVSGAQSGELSGAGDTGLVLVRVVDATTDAPIDGAIVQLSRLGRGSQLPRQTADPRGRAVFPNLSPGRYRLTASAAGYMEGVLGAQGPAHPMERAGSTIEGLVEVTQEGGPREAGVRLWRYSQITGRVFDNDGEPLIGASVMAAQLGEGLGGSMVRPRGRTGGRTNDRGEYTIDNLMPGDYLVGVASSRTAGPGAAARAARAMVRPTVYFGDVFTPSIALRVPLGAGATREGIDITIPSIPLRHVSGRVLGADGNAATLPLRLVPAEADDEAIEVLPPTAVTNPDASGAFTFAGVPAGDYIVYAAQGAAAQGMAMGGGSLVSAPGAAEPGSVLRLANRGVPGDTIAWARTPVAVGDHDVTRLEVAMHPGLNLRVRFVVDARTGGASPDVSKLSVRLQPQMVPQTGAGMRGTIALAPLDGDLVSASLLPGTYGVDLSAGGALVISAVRVNGNSRPGRIFELHDDATVEVVVTNRLGTLTGTVEDALSVVVFAADPDSWRFAAGDRARARQVDVDENDAFSFSALPIGDYIVVASDWFPRAWAQTDSLDALAKRGTRVAVREGQTTNVSLQPTKIQ